MKTHDSVLCAKYLLAVGYSKKIALNMTKLQKLLYILYGYYLARESHLILDESPKIWPFGPVFPKVHKKLDMAKIPDLSDPAFDSITEDQHLVSIVNSIVDRYAKFSATQLSNWSHMEGSPWDLTVKESGSKWNTPIPNEYISQYFSSINTI